MESFLLALGALAPCSILLLLCTYLLTRMQPAERYREIIICFVLGLLSIVIVFVIAAPLDQFTMRFVQTPVVMGLYDAFIIAALPEEFSRFCVLRWRLGLKTNPLNSRRCMLLGAVVGLGFAAIENVFYCVKTGWFTVLERSVTAVPYHTLSGAIVGYAVGFSLYKRQLRWAFLGVITTAILHGINNFNFKLFYDDEFPTQGFEAILITGWPSNLAVLLVSAGLVFWLARSRRFGISH